VGLMELLSKAVTVAMVSFVVSSMLAMGAALTVSQIFDPLRNVRLVMLALVANFVLRPLGAFALAKVLWLGEPLGVGLLLLGCAAGAPFLPKLAQLAKGTLPFGVGAMVLLMVITVAYLPIVLPLLLPGVTVNPVKIAQSLVLLMLLPLAIGLFVKARYEATAARVRPPLDRLSNVSLILLIVLITVVNFESSPGLWHSRHSRGASVHRAWILLRLNAHAAFSCVGQSLSRYGIRGWQFGVGRDCYVTFPVLLHRLTCGSLRPGQQRVRHYRSPILRCTA
jgi:bile acid:Na+ symporter, BASS family